MALQAVSPLNLERYEVKYLVPMDMVDAISDYVAQYCEMDYYSQISSDGFYVINSLYLDTPSLFLFHKPQTGSLDYSCFRIRSYGADPKPPYYFESKQKIREFSKKRRGKIPIENFGDIFDNPQNVKGFDPYADKNVRDFIEKVTTFGLSPQILTQYRRRAFLSVHDDYARVTFDRDMCYRDEKGWSVKPDARMTHYDHPDSFDLRGSGANVILELKCERKIPIWMVQLVRHFGLVRHGFSKYQSSTIEMYGWQTQQLAFDQVNARDAADSIRYAR